MRMRVGKRYGCGIKIWRESGMNGKNDFGRVQG